MTQLSKKVYIIGSKGIPARYGGFETFIDQLVSGRKAAIQYVITGMAEESSDYEYKGARCVQFATGSSVVARMLHTLKALWFVLKDAKGDAHSKVVYILGCRAGIFLPFFKSALQNRGVAIYVNPDGAEWKRAKWNIVAKKVVLLFEWLLVKNADLVISDSMAIQDIMKNEFQVPVHKLAFAAYGSEIYEAPATLPTATQRAYDEWVQKRKILNAPYFLMVGRFVPENNFELVIKEFMASSVKAHLVIVSNISDGSLKTLLYEKLNIGRDPRIKMVGTLYDQDVLKVVRSKAVAYIHGHEVGGTNPSLLEALGSTQVSIVYDVSFNREVVQDAGLYFTSQPGSLGEALDQALTLPMKVRRDYENLAKNRIKADYSWPEIVSQYEQLFLERS
jgi:rhamnosyltransferase